MKTGPASRLALWWEAARPRTLPAAVAPVLVASALAWRQDGFVAPAALACLTFAVLIQIGTNYANDYFDFVKGADTAARVGPRRAVAAGLISPAAMKRAMGWVFFTAFVVGLSLLRFGGWPLLVIGVASIVCGIAYTGGPYPLAYHGWGDVFVFVFFGLVAVGATYFVQVGTLTADAIILGAGIGALATNILVVNNYRDGSTDRVAGKRTLVVRWGERAARLQFAASHGVATAAVILLAARGVYGFGAAGLLGLFVVLRGVAQMRRLAEAKTPADLIALLGETGRHLGWVALIWSSTLAAAR